MSAPTPSWSPPAHRDETTVQIAPGLQEETKKALEQTLITGLDRMAFSQEHLVNLSLLLWEKTDESFGPCADTVSWLQETPYFRDYLAKDPAFGDVLAGVLPEQEHNALHAAAASKADSAKERAQPEGVSPSDVEANVVVES